MIFYKVTSGSPFIPSACSNHLRCKGIGFKYSGLTCKNSSKCGKSLQGEVVNKKACLSSKLVQHGDVYSGALHSGKA